ncbi:MAG: DHH family phosphoesterase, partial [Magnetococcus sp. WYHC-3]
MKPDIQDPKVKELAALLKAREGQRHVVVIQDFPDPDAISCAFAYRMIAEEYNIQTDVVYNGRISHQENLALINLLDIEIHNCKVSPMDLSRFDGAVFVDGQGTTSSLTERLTAAQVPVLVVVDHHDLQEGVTAQFTDMRPSGSCASIFAHYLHSGLLTLREGHPAHRRLATALLHGILSDTGSMIRAKPFDFAAASLLQGLINQDLLVEIMHQRRSHKVMEVIRLALANRVSREGYCLSGVGYLRAEERDAIPQAADFLLTEDSVHTAIVYGVVAHADDTESIHGLVAAALVHDLHQQVLVDQSLQQAGGGEVERLGP